jgi:hypothetical protein
VVRPAARAAGRDVKTRARRGESTGPGRVPQRCPFGCLQDASATVPVDIGEDLGHVHGGDAVESRCASWQAGIAAPPGTTQKTTARWGLRCASNSAGPIGRSGQRVEGLASRMTGVRTLSAESVPGWQPWFAGACAPRQAPCRASDPPGARSSGKHTMTGPRTYAGATRRTGYTRRPRSLTRCDSGTPSCYFAIRYKTTEGKEGLTRAQGCA